MLGRKYCVAFNYHGTLAEDCQGQFELDQPATLMHVSFCASNGSDATVDVGDTGDPNGIISLGACGDTNVPAEFEPADFNGALCDQIAGWHFNVDDKVVKFSIVYGDVLGTAANDVALVFTFYEG